MTDLDLPHAALFEGRTNTRGIIRRELLVDGVRTVPQRAIKYRDC
jgi:hypothetical protein